MGLYFARTRRTWGEPCASITWREYVAGLSAATDPTETATAVLPEELRLRPEGAPVGRPGIGPSPARGRGSAVAHLEIALRLVQRRARRAVGLAEVLRLECEAAKLRLLLIPLYMRLGEVDKARALAREAQATL
jgi:hypothetical protein